MLTDERPANWHDDSYIRSWARNRGLGRLPKAYVALITVNRDGPDTAEISFDTEGEPVRRFRMQRVADSARDLPQTHTD